ncbi:RNA ligase family protein [Engelhardtia mirabilis]|uniref:RNA ligase n=1 Tax=Engelhardtia mirabilis TaxID=2528011 RepID=A0A518BL10_9BACT|nr:RNA ligase [Planctomycetes bacterium Pla133]QDV01983.1 RNA ligase [Planctomycetes bacterium Pla86]
MSEYHKIQTVWLRDPETNHKTLLEGRWAKPEFEYLRKNSWTFTEKIDGTNVRLIRANGCDVRGKTFRAQLPRGVFEAGARIVKSSAFARLPEEMVLYGEGYGAKIQKGGGNYRQDQGIVLFDAWCGMWLERSSLEEIAESLGLEVAPVIGSGRLSIAIDWCRSGDLKSRWGDFPAEGIVARPEVEMLNRRGERVITKIKCRDFREGRAA